MIQSILMLSVEPQKWSLPEEGKTQQLTKLNRICIDETHKYNYKKSNQFNSFHNWKFGTLNVRSGKEKLEGARIYEITKEVARAKLNFCVLQQVRHRNTGRKIIELNSGERYVFLWCGKKKRRDAGVGILIKKERGLAFSEPDFNDPRVMSLNMSIHGFKIRLVIGYSPTNISDSESLKDEFYRNLKKSIELCPKHHKLIVAGDFNAETSIVYAKNEFDGV